MESEDASCDYANDWQKNILAWLLATFFLIGAVVNLMGLGEAPKDYARWGYPDGFHWS